MERRCSSGEGDGETRSMSSGDWVGRCSRWAMWAASSEMYEPIFSGSYLPRKEGV